MAYDIVMPRLGLTMEEGSVSSWLKKPGEWVEKGENLFTVETDKVDMEVESLGSGYLNAILVPIGQKVPVGTPIAKLGDQPAAVETPGLAAAPAPAPSAQPAPAVLKARAGRTDAAPAAGDHVPISPRARRLAHELGIDIEGLRPARGQRVVEEDVRRYHSQMSATVPHAPPLPVVSRAAETRRITAERTSESFERAPHFYLGVEIDASELVNLREQLLAAVSQRAGARLTYTDLFLRALAVTLKEQPNVNAFSHEGKLQQRTSVDVGFAAQTPAGLLVPVIRHADQLKLFDLARQRHTLAEKARAGTLTLSELEGGSATLSNLGQFGVDWFQAILNPPQSILLATGQISKRAVVTGDRVEVSPTCILTLAADHRVLDGVAAAMFLRRIRELLESPYLLLVD